MAQKKASAPPPPPLPKGNATAGGTGGNSAGQPSGTTGSSQTAVTPPGTSSGSAASSSAAQQQQQQAPLSKTVSAPTSPQGQQGQMTSSAGGQVPNGSVPSAAKQSNSMKPGKTGLSGSSVQLSAPVHAALTASKSAPASPQKEKLAAEAVKSS